MTGWMSEPEGWAFRFVSGIRRCQRPPGVRKLLSHPWQGAANALTFDGLVGELRSLFERFPDPRTGNNTRYQMADVAASAFAIFFVQSPSFLAYPRTMQEANGQSNAQTLFGVTELPTDNRIRTLLDGVPYTHVLPMFSNIFQSLAQSGALEPFRVLDHQVLIALDGTQYFSSSKLSCPNCSETHHRNGQVSFSHSVITPVLVAPGQPRVIALEPEFITPQDGTEKQDCETAAAKRWLHRYAERYRPLGATLLGDDLYSHQPMCELIVEQGLNFIFVCKPQSHPTLDEWVEGLAAAGHVETVVRQRRRGKLTYTDTYRFVNEVPLRDGEDAMKVNWCELTTTRGDGKRTYHNAFATNHRLTHSNVVEVVAAGRARWKIENENNNILKTKGYHLEHNFGHGQQHLSSLLVTFNLLAFLFHTVLEINDEHYRAIRQALPRRQTFFDDLRALTRYWCFESWRAMLLFMMRGLKIEIIDTS